MRDRNDVIKSAEDLIRSVLEKNFNQRIDSESLRAAAEKIVRGLPDSVDPEESKRAA